LNNSELLKKVLKMAEENSNVTSNSTPESKQAAILTADLKAYMAELDTQRSTMDKSSAEYADNLAKKATAQWLSTEFTLAQQFSNGQGANTVKNHAGMLKQQYEIVVGLSEQASAQSAAALAQAEQALASSAVNVQQSPVGQKNAIELQSTQAKSNAVNPQETIKELQKKQVQHLGNLQNATDAEVQSHLSAIRHH
jgi:hypothetical protein